MGIIELLGLAGSVSLLSGWRLYATILITGLAMRSGWVPLPEQLQAIADALGQIRYGVIQLTVHDGRLMQLDITERRRFA